MKGGDEVKKPELVGQRFKKSLLEWPPKGMSRERVFRMLYGERRAFAR